VPFGGILLFSISGLFKFASRNSHLTDYRKTPPQATATLNTVTVKLLVLQQRSTDIIKPTNTSQTLKNFVGW
jgi:hypothetical protein